VPTLQFELASLPADASRATDTLAEAQAMSASAPGSWSLRLGRWRGVEVRVHIYLPLLALVALLLATPPILAVGDFSSQLPLSPVPRVLMGLAVLVFSVVIHELVRAAITERVGGRTNLIVIGPTGGWAQPHLPADPPAQLVTAISGPLTYLALLVSAGCALAAAGEHSILGLLSPFKPSFLPTESTLHLAAQLMVWINACLLLINLLPIQPCDGVELIRGLLWPLVGRASAAMAVAHIAYGAAAATAVLAVVAKDDSVNNFLPAWFPLATASVLLLYGGNRAARQRQYDVGLAIDELESDDEQWLSAEWIEEERAAVLVEQVQEKQQETIDRKRREREDREDARVDDILVRLQEVGFEQLSEEEQAVLKRASRRYRQRRRDANQSH
jgi:Zn-dependent protease